MGNYYTAEKFIMLLYSTNVYLKFYIQNKFRGDIHYVWCSEYFDSNKLSSYSPGSQIPPTSNPVNIYRDLKQAVERKDSHNYKIIEQKASIKSLANEWEKKNEITVDERDEIIYWVDTLSFDYWRPLLYVIPINATIKGKMQLVPANKRAGLGEEYIIEDLKRSEFDIIEF